MLLLRRGSLPRVVALYEAHRETLFAPSRLKGTEMNEKAVTMLWRKLFRGQEVTSLTLKEAGELLDELSPESPLRLRLTTELDELRNLQETS